jgi:hypothetical protein
VETAKKKLEDYVILIRGKDLSFVQRRILVALITQEVKNRDVVEELESEQVDTLDYFSWQKQLRYG